MREGAAGTAVVAIITIVVWVGRVEVLDAGARPVNGVTGKGLNSSG